MEQVLAAVSTAATGKGVDADYVRRIFTDQIDATEAIEYTRFAQWKLDPGSAQSVAPDLAASRAIIDRLNAEMVEQVAMRWPVLHSPDCTGTLDDARTAGRPVAHAGIRCIGRRFRSRRTPIASDRRSIGFSRRRRRTRQTEAAWIAAPCSSLGPLPRNASTAACDSHRSKMLTRPGSSRSADSEKSRQPGRQAGLTHHLTHPDR